MHKFLIFLCGIAFLILLFFTSSPIQYLAHLSIALIATATAALIALRRFKTEKWFTLKAATYIEILTSVHHMTKPIKMILDDYEESKIIEYDEESGMSYENGANQIPQYKIEKRARFEDARKNAEDDLDKKIDISFMLEEEVIEQLKKLKGYLSSLEDLHESEYQDYKESIRETIDNCYSEIKRIAKKDLEKSWG